MSNRYPAWICSDCGKKYGTVISGHCCTMHNDVCGWCGEWKACTEPRDYKYPPAPKNLVNCDWCQTLIPEGTTIGGECVACSMSSLEKIKRGEMQP